MLKVNTTSNLRVMDNPRPRPRLNSTEPRLPSPTVLHLLSPTERHRRLLNPTAPHLRPVLRRVNTTHRHSREAMARRPRRHSSSLMVRSQDTDNHLLRSHMASPRPINTSRMDIITRQPLPLSDTGLLKSSRGAVMMMHAH